MPKNAKKGFSLVELLVVITIIAILSVTAFVALGGQTAKARNSKRMQDLTSIESALEIFFINNDNQYPVDLNELSDNPPPGQQKLLRNMPVDPTTKGEYAYISPLANKYYLGATLESEDGEGFKSYIIGNTIMGESYLPGVDIFGEACDTVEDDGQAQSFDLNDDGEDTDYFAAQNNSTTCFPY